MMVDKCRKICISLKYKYYGVEVRICNKIINIIWKIKFLVKKFKFFLIYLYVKFYREIISKDLWFFINYDVNIYL